MKSAIYRFRLTGLFIALCISLSANAATSNNDLPVGEALNLYHAAVRQSEATTSALQTGTHDQASSDNAYQAAFRNAVWEGLKLIRPQATPEERAHMASLINTAKSLADASAGSALGYYIATGVEIDQFIEIGVQRDADDAFRLGYAQALKRERATSLED